MNIPADSIRMSLIVLLCLWTWSALAQDQSADLDDLKSKVKHPESGTIVLPLRIHIMTDLTINHPEKKLTCWFVRSQVAEVVKEVNLIWQQADVEWFVESIVEHEPFTSDMTAAQYIVNARRNDEGRSDRARIPKVYSYFDARKHNPVMQNLYFFPFIGNTSQGFAGDPIERGGHSNHAVVGTWSNKIGGDVPYQTQITEREPDSLVTTPPQNVNFFEKGSLGRTCAHELGHHLGLSHPDKDTQTDSKRLMGGKRQAYTLTTDEIATAREEATRRAKSFLSWDPSSLPELIKGSYQRNPIENQWHEGTIEGAEKPGKFRWTNEAGKTWNLQLDSSSITLITGEDNPYYNTSPADGREFRIALKRKSKSGKSTYEVKGFRFKQELYERVAN